MWSVFTCDNIRKLKKSAFNWTLCSDNDSQRKLNSWSDSSDVVNNGTQEYKGIVIFEQKYTNSMFSKATFDYNLSMSRIEKLLSKKENQWSYMQVTSVLKKELQQKK